MVSGNLDRMAAVGTEIPSGFTCEIQLETTAANTVLLVADLSLEQGSYIASPHSPDTILGHFRFEILDGPVQFAGTLTETPVPPLTYDPYLEQHVRWTVGRATFSQGLNVPEGEFDARGEVFFVLEPACTPQVLPFEIWRDATGLHAEQRPGC